MLQCCTLITIPVCVCANMLFQSIGLAGRASLLACLRSGVLFIPVLLLLAHFFGLRGIALAQPAADVLAMLISLPFLLGFLHQLPKSEA